LYILGILPLAELYHNSPTGETRKQIFETHAAMQRHIVFFLLNWMTLDTTNRRKNKQQRGEYDLA
jgi:hypothetical protein